MISHKGSFLLTMAFLILFIPGVAAVAQTTLSSWQLTETRCRSSHGELTVARIFHLSLPLIGPDFEPQIRLNFIEYSSGVQALQKVVLQGSCHQKQLNVPYMMTSTYQVRLSPELKNRLAPAEPNPPLSSEATAPVEYPMAVARVLDSDINRAANWQCSPLLAGIVWFLFPEHFQKEAGRLYHLSFAQPEALSVAFVDNTICAEEGAQVVMDFQRVR